jgi:DNA-binding NtrC family response regulator
VALYRVLIVDDSPAVRETVSILLGAEYEVHTARWDDYLTRGPQEPAPHVIIAARAAGQSGAGVFPAGVPVLWLDQSPMAAPGTALPPRQFSPRVLRQRVADLLAAPPVRGGAIVHAARLQPPYVSADAAHRLACALHTDLPLHLVGEPGTGKRSVARAIHAATDRTAFLALSGMHLDPAALTVGRGGGTVFIDRIEHLAASAQEALLAVLDPAGLVRSADGGTSRLITAAAIELAAAVDAGAFSPDLYYRLNGLTVHLGPLRERPLDLPALAQTLTGELCALLGRAPVTLTPAALERLCNYLWFGNMAEFESVLARSVALCRAAVIDAADLLFDATHIGSRAEASRMSEPDAHAAATLDGRPLDLIINELAHEFKNPLVTIKTFAHHLHRSLPSGGEDAQVARLTGDAVEQIDQALENLLAFTRLETPVAQTIALPAVIDPVLEACGHALAARGVGLHRPATPPVDIQGDPQQLIYALSNLIRALSRDLGPSTALAVRFGAPAIVTIELPTGAGPLGSRLAEFLDRDHTDSPAVPLGVAIASAVLERNGACVVLSSDPPTTIAVRFRLADPHAEVAGNGTSPRLDR